MFLDGGSRTFSSLNRSNFYLQYFDLKIGVRAPKAFEYLAKRTFKAQCKLENLGTQGLQLP
jgi:hypothetical protein